MKRLLNRWHLAATITAAVLVAVAVLAVSVATAQPNPTPITTRVKLLETELAAVKSDLKRVTAQIEAGPRPAESRCNRGPNHDALDTWHEEDHHALGTRHIGTFQTYLIDCGPHGVTRHHTDLVFGNPSWSARCIDLNGITATSTNTAPETWAAWWKTTQTTGINDACAATTQLADAINNGTPIPDGQATNLMLHHTDPLLGWERWHPSQHPALPTTTPSDG